MRIETSTVPFRASYGLVPTLSKGRRLDLLITVLLLAMAVVSAAEGPVRYGLSAARLQNLLYLRDLFMLVAVTAWVARPLNGRDPMPTEVLIALGILLTYFCTSLLGGLPVFTALLGLKTLLWLVFGMVAHDAIRSYQRPYIWTLAGLFVIEAIAVVANHYLGMLPWEGVAYDTVFGTVNTTREWWVEGQRRLPGLSRSSFEAAIILGVGACAASSLTTSRSLRALVMSIALLAIVLTTAKGMVSAVVAAMACGLVPSKWRKVLLRYGTPAFLALVVTLPVAVVGLDLVDRETARNAPRVLGSLMERFQVMWPAAFNLLGDPLQWIFGRGLGGIGVPQTLAEPYRSNAADNFFLFLYVVFGVAALPAISLVAVASWKLSSRTDTESLFLGGVALIAATYGLTTNLIEVPYISILLGMLIMVACRSAPPANLSATTVGLPRTNSPRLD